MTYGNYSPYYRGNYMNPLQTSPIQQFQPNDGMYQQAYQPQTQPFSSPNNGDLIFVLNENEASSYPVAPNNSVVLWDKNMPTIYIKSSDARGIPTMRVLDFKERTQDQKQTPAEQKQDVAFVPLETFEQLKSEFDDLKKKCDELLKKNYVKLKKTEVESNE